MEEQALMCTVFMFKGGIWTYEKLGWGEENASDGIVLNQSLREYILLPFALLLHSLSCLYSCILKKGIKHLLL